MKKITALLGVSVAAVTLGACTVQPVERRTFVYQEPVPVPSPVIQRETRYVPVPLSPATTTTTTVRRIY